MRWIVVFAFGVILWFVIAGQMTAANTPTFAEKLLKQGDLVKAQQEFEKLIQSNPADPQAYLAVASSCKREGKIELALKYLERALHACKDAPSAGRAELYSAQGAISALIEKKPQNQTILSLQRASQLDSNNPQRLNEYAYVLADNLPEGDPRLDESIALLTRALVLIKPEKNPWTRLFNPLVELTKELSAPAFEDSYGWALYKQNRTTEAIRALEQAIQDDEKLTATGKQSREKAEDASLLKVLYYHLGAAYLKGDRKDDARRALKISLGYDPKYEDAKVALATLEGKG